jgi:hypothetical protein
MLREQMPLYFEFFGPPLAPGATGTDGRGPV